MYDCDGVSVLDVRAHSAQHMPQTSHISVHRVVILCVRFHLLLMKESTVRQPQCLLARDPTDNMDACTLHASNHTMHYNAIQWRNGSEKCETIECIGARWTTNRGTSAGVAQWAVVGRLGHVNSILFHCIAYDNAQRNDFFCNHWGESSHPSWDIALCSHSKRHKSTDSFRRSAGVSVAHFGKVQPFWAESVMSSNNEPIASPIECTQLQTGW